jgi:hypothetical protein
MGAMLSKAEVKSVRPTCAHIYDALEFPQEMIAAIESITDNYNVDSLKADNSNTFMLECESILQSFPSVVTTLLPCGQHAEAIGVTCILLKVAGPRIATTNATRKAYETIYTGLLEVLQLILFTHAHAHKHIVPSSRSSPLPVCIQSALLQLRAQCDALQQLYASAGKAGGVSRLWHTSQWHHELENIAAALSSIHKELLTTAAPSTDVVLQRAVEGMERIRPTLQPPPFHLLAALTYGYKHDARAFLGSTTLATSTSGYNSLSLHTVFVDASVQALSLEPEEMPADSESNSSEMVSRRLEVHQRCGDALVYTASSVLTDASLHRCVLMGGPGCGKSSTCKRFVSSWANMTLIERASIPVPMLIGVNKYANWKCCRSDVSIEEFMCQGGVAGMVIDAESLMRQLQAAAPGTLVLLDGLDEVPDPALRCAVLEDLLCFSARYAHLPSLRIIVTTRVIGYKPNDLPGFAHYTIQPLSSAQVGKFIHRWHEATHLTGQAGINLQREQRLLDGVDTNPVLHELSANPLLLTMICMVNRGLVLPDEKLPLYDKCSEMLLSLWKYTDGQVAGVSPAIQECINNYMPQSIKHAMMCDIAWSMQRTAGEGGPLHSLISRDALMTVMQKSLEHHTRGISPDIIACALIRLLDERHRVLCYVGDRWYTFIHRTFLEYYVAKAVELQWNDRSIGERDLNNIFIAHGADPTWHEVLGHVTGLIHPKFIGPCLHRLLEDGNAELVAKCIPMLRASDPAADQMAQKLRELQERLSKTVDPSSDPMACSTLAGLPE